MRTKSCRAGSGCLPSGMPATLLIFPHQLFLEHPGLDRCDAAMLVEDGLFFGDHRLQAAMHRQKLWLHRASMKRYEHQLIDRGIDVRYLDHEDGVDMVDVAVSGLAGSDRAVVAGDPHDYLLERRLRRAAERHGLDLQFVRTPMFINTSQQNRDYRDGKKRWFMADFYKHQRRRLDVLMDGDEPVGGQWSFDADNRKKVPKKMLGAIPDLPTGMHDDTDEAARLHVQDRYPVNPGSIALLRQWLHSAFVPPNNGRPSLFAQLMRASEEVFTNGMKQPMRLNVSEAGGGGDEGEEGRSEDERMLHPRHQNHQNNISSSNTTE